MNSRHDGIEHINYHLNDKQGTLKSNSQSRNRLVPLAVIPLPLWNAYDKDVMSKISQLELAAAIQNIRPEWLNNIDDIKQSGTLSENQVLTVIPLAMSQSDQAWPDEYEVIIDENSYEMGYEEDSGYLETTIRIVSEGGYIDRLIEVKDALLDDSSLAMNELAKEIVETIEYDEAKVKDKWHDDGWSDENDDPDY